MFMFGLMHELLEVNLSWTPMISGSTKMGILQFQNVTLELFSNLNRKAYFQKGMKEVNENPIR